MEHQEEFDHIFREYYAQLFVFARRFIDDIDDCHDLVNDVYEDVWLHFHDIRQEAVRTYLYTNLRHKCVDFLRRKKTRKKYEIFTLALAERFDSTDRILEMEEREAIIKKTIEMLPDTTRTIFILCFVEHKKYAEAAEVLHVSLSTIKKHIVRALKLIRESRGGNDESHE